MGGGGAAVAFPMRRRIERLVSRRLPLRRRVLRHCGDLDDEPLFEDREIAFVVCSDEKVSTIDE